MECLTYGSLFTGIGGFDLGFDRAGMRNIWQVEIDKDCNRVLEKHWHETKRFRDITKIDTTELGKPDVICGGFPCQDLSVAGQRAGLAGKRSGLWREFHRVIAGVTPRFVVIENVPGLFSSNEGRDFLTIIRGLAQLGYCLAWTVLDSQYRGVAQRRDRVFIIGSLGNGSCAEILFEPESVCGHSPPSRETWKRIAGTIGGSSQSGGFRTTDLDNNGAFIPQVARSLNSERDGYNDGSDQTYVADCLQERDSKGSDSNTKRGHLIPILEAGARTGKSTDDPRAGMGIGEDGDPMFSLQSGKQHAVAFTQNQREEVRKLSKAGSVSSIRRGDAKQETLIAFGCKDHGQDSQNDLSPTLRSMSHEDGNANRGGQVAVAFTIQNNDGGNHKRKDRPNGGLYVKPAEKSLTVGTTDMTAIVQWASGGGKTENPSAQALRSQAEHNYQFARVGSSVRRLTPRECERLQGFPDDWTRWDANGKEISDSARYRMLGNAVTVPVAGWIGQQLVRFA